MQLSVRRRSTEVLLTIVPSVELGCVVGTKSERPGDHVQAGDTCFDGQNYDATVLGYRNPRLCIAHLALADLKAIEQALGLEGLSHTLNMAPDSSPAVNTQRLLDELESSQ